MTFTSDDVDLFGRHVGVACELGKRLEMLYQNVVHRVGRGHHGCPHIGANGVVGAESVVRSLFGNDLTLTVKAHPVGRVAARGGAYERAYSTFDNRIPGLIFHCKAAHDEDRVVRRIERYEIFLLKALVARQKNLAESLDVAHVLHEQIHHGFAFGRIVRTVPQTACFEQTVGNPHVTVGGVVAVDDAPAVAVLTPKPRRLVLGDVARSEIVFRPLQEFFERVLITGDQGKEHGVGLAFTCRDAAVVAVIHNAERVVDVCCLESIPLVPSLSRGAKTGQHGTDGSGANRTGNEFHVWFSDRIRATNGRATNGACRQRCPSRPRQQQSKRRAPIGTDDWQRKPRRVGTRGDLQPTMSARA